MTKFNFTAEELNKILGWGEVKHSDRYNRLRKKFADMDDDRFNEVYRAFYDGSNGTTSTLQGVSESEAKFVCCILNVLADSNIPASFSDIYYNNINKRRKFGKATFVTSEDIRDRLQRIIDELEKTHKVEGLRVINIMTQGKCHIKLYEIR